MDRYYQLPLPKFAQGDIFLDVPSIYLGDDAVTFLRRRDARRGPLADIYVLDDESHTPRQPFNRQGDEVAAKIQLAPGMLLTHACEVDNSPRACVGVALIRPLGPVPPESREAITSGKNLRLLYLPENDVPAFEESYVDFSRITSLRLDAIPREKQILSAAPDLVKALYVGMTRYFTRFDISSPMLEPLIAEAIPEASQLPEPTADAG